MSKKDPPRTSALSTAVSDLIRAAHGGEAHNVPDDDLDRYVADLILKEAVAKKEKYDRVGVRAYQPNYASQPPNRLNKRFLMNIVKSTDTHNQTLLRQEREEEEARRARRTQQKEDDDHDARDRHRHKRRKRHASPRDDSRDTKRRHHHRHHREDDTHATVPKSDSPRPADTASPATQVKVRGRGRAQAGSSFTAMDRHFSDQYNPLFDIESDPETPVLNEVESRKEKKVKKEKRKKDKKKKKKKKRHHSSSDDESSQDEVTVQPPPPTRAWDVGKELQ